jgi:N-acyl-D-amino-acid deacylase
VLDLWIPDATIVDGTGAPRYRASVGVEGGRVALIRRAALGPGASVEAAITMPAEGLTLAPGFIDVHNHSDMAPFVVPDMPSTIRQGVTTVVVGNCGASPFPPSSAAELASWSGADHEHPHGRPFDSFGDLLTKVEQARPAVHIAALIGHGSVRELVMGLERRPPTDVGLRAMRTLVAEAMSAGAVGLSTGLIYAPGMHAGTDEIVTLAAEAARAGGIYASHIRGEGAHLFRAVDEAIEVGARAGIEVHVSHLKCETSFAWGRASELLGRMHDARATGDQYPYAAWASSLSSLLPPWAPVGELRELLSEPGTRARLVASVERGEGQAFQSSVDGVGWDRIVIESTADATSRGRSIAEVARRRGIEPVDACFELLVEEPATSCIGHAMHDDDVRAITADPGVMVASDSAAVAPDGPMSSVPVHPRTYGTFPRVLGQNVREGLLSLENAVRKMTSLPADRFGLMDRGRITEGAWADLVLFDPATVADRSTFDRPHTFPGGIEAVVVEGTTAWRRGSDSIERAGRVLRRGGA